MAINHRLQQPRHAPATDTDTDQRWLAQLEADILAQDLEDARRE